MTQAWRPTGRHGTPLAGRGLKESPTRPRPQQKIFSIPNATSAMTKRTEEGKKRHAGLKKATHENAALAVTIRRPPAVQPPTAFTGLRLPSDCLLLPNSLQMLPTGSQWRPLISGRYLLTSKCRPVGEANPKLKPLWDAGAGPVVARSDPILDRRRTQAFNGNQPRSLRACDANVVPLFAIKLGPALVLIDCAIEVHVHLVMRRGRELQTLGLHVQLNTTTQCGK